MRLGSLAVTAAEPYGGDIREQAGTQSLLTVMSNEGVD